MNAKKMKAKHLPWKGWSQVLLGAGILLLPVSACAPGGKVMTAELKVVPYVKLERYTGTWYEIAWYPQHFQEGCVASKKGASCEENNSLPTGNGIGGILGLFQ